jgi:hypothetical protein
VPSKHIKVTEKDFTYIPTDNNIQQNQLRQAKESALVDAMGVTRVHKLERGRTVEESIATGGSGGTDGPAALLSLGHGVVLLETHVGRRSRRRRSRLILSRWEVERLWSRIDAEIILNLRGKNPCSVRGVASETIRMSLNEV